MKLYSREEKLQHRALRVLVADDCEAVRQTLRQFLASLPQFEVVGQAKNGAEALRAIAELRPDVVILDIHMPGTNGLEVLEALQKEGSTCTVFVFSQFAEELYRDKCLQLGAHGFFDKVADFDKFHRALKKMKARP